METRKGIATSAFLLLSMLFCQSSGVLAQDRVWPPDVYLKPAIYGVLVDSLTGQPIPHASIRVEGGRGISRADSVGRYLLFGLPIGEQRVRLFCPVERRYWGREFAGRLINVTEGTDSLHNFIIPREGCDEPPLESWRGEFTGHYTFGFESSTFKPCDQFSDLRGTAYEGARDAAWVEFAPGAWKKDDWPTTGDEPYPEFFVRWRGFVEGPGAYGHLGSATFDMEVTEVLEVRVPGPNDCRLEEPYDSFQWSDTRRMVMVCMPKSSLRELTT